ncbi:energy-coupling factor transporter ATPase [Amphibacillus sp. Q70]|uniref:energy-coupling factor transporter ATPase n=1 Tax=Amphibacillus sp. Q70 TaxID=3453416 RepID=UPI003F850F6B
MEQVPILSLKDVSYRYDMRSQRYALSNASFDVMRGQWLAILGDNGSGKSTLARLIVGLATQESGSIQFNQEVINEQNKSKLREKVGIVFQNPDNQFIGTTVQDDVAFALENLNMSYSDMKQRVFDALKQVDMYELRDKDPSQLSGGQKQRVAIAGILALEPELMIFDEAFIMLDPKSRRELLNTLKSIQRKYHLTIISITHDHNEAVLADRMVFLNEGRVVDQGNVQAMFDRNRDIQPPFAEQFRRELEQRGIPVPNHYMSDDELVAWLCE